MAKATVKAENNVEKFFAYEIRPVNIDHLRSKIQNQSRVINSLQKALDEERRKFHAMERDMSGTCHTLIDVQRQLDEEKGKVQSLLADLQGAKYQIDNLRSQKNKLNAKLELMAARLHEEDKRKAKLMEILDEEKKAIRADYITK